MSLSLTHTISLAVVLENCSDKLAILGHTLKINSVRGSAAVKEIARLTKLKRDCHLISQHITKLCSELEEMQTFTSLQQVVEEEKQKKEAGSMRRGEGKILKQRKEHLTSKQQEFQQKTEKLKEVYQLAKDLKLQLIEKSSNIVNQKTILVKSIEMQLQQTQKETSQTEKLLEDKLKLLQKQRQEEIRVHEESEIFLQNQNKEFQQKLQQWQEYTKQMQKEKEQQLYNVQCKRTIHLDRLMEKKRWFREMEQVVVEDREKLEKLQLQQAEARAAIKEFQQKLQQWQEYTKQMQKEKEQQLYNVQCKRTIHLDRLMEKKRWFREMEQVVVEDREKLEKLQLQQAEARAAIKLQAWWRGCTVRHGLSFRKPEQDKKGKKKEEKRRNKK